MIIKKQEIDGAIERIETAKKDLKRQLAQLAEDEALFRRMKRAAESEASPEELEGLELEELRFLKRAIKTLTAHEEMESEKTYQAKHEAKGFH